MKSKVLLIFFLFPAVASAVSYGNSSAMFLSDDPSARGFSVGGLYLPLQDDPSAAHVNPGLLGRARFSAVSLSLWKGVDGVSNYSFLGGVFKTENYGNFLASFSGYNSGEEEVFDISGVSSKITMQKDYAISAGWGSGINNNIFFGFKAKSVNSNLAEEYSAETFAFDLGMVFKVDREISASLSTENLAGSLKYKSDPEPLPRNIRFEMAQNIAMRYGRINAGIGVKKETREEYLNLLGGLEWVFRNIPLAARGGFRNENKTFAFNAGIGIFLKNFCLDYGMQLPEKLGNRSQRITVSLAFGSAAEKGPAKKAKKEKSAWEKARRERVKEKKKEKTKSKKERKEEKAKMQEYWDGWFIIPQ